MSPSPAEGDSQVLHCLSLADFLEKYPFSDDQPLVADWDYGPRDVRERADGKPGKAAEVAAKYGGPPATAKNHVDFKLNPLWIPKHKPWKPLGAPDGNWYKDTLDAALKTTAQLWKVLE